MDTFTSLLAGFTVFAVMGNLATLDRSKSISDIVQGGPGLAFVLVIDCFSLEFRLNWIKIKRSVNKRIFCLLQYPQAIATFDWVPQLFAVLFFLMLFTLGVGSATSLTGGVITIICDQFPTWKRWLVTTVVCVGGCLLGLMYVTEVRKNKKMALQFLFELMTGERIAITNIIYEMHALKNNSIGWPIYAGLNWPLRRGLVVQLIYEKQLYLFGNIFWGVDLVLWCLIQVSLYTWWRFCCVQVMHAVNIYWIL